jgi:ABC-type transport system involved in multi-copper enzyme maturation permease subunit
MSLAIAGVRKFRTRSATIVSLLIAVILVALLIVLEGVSYRSVSTQNGVDPRQIAWFLTFPGAFDAVLTFVFAFFGLIGLIYVATACGSEWSWGTLKVAVARGESRWKYTLATFASLAIVLFVGMIITFASGLAAAVVGASIAGIPLGNPFDPAVLGRVLMELVRCWIALLSLTSLAYAVAMVAKSQMAGIGTVIGYYLVSLIGPALLPDFVKEVFKYLPFSIAGDAIGLQGPPTNGVASSVSAVDPNVALLITIAWLVGCLAVAAFSVERTEISG